MEVSSFIVAGSVASRKYSNIKLHIVIGWFRGEQDKGDKQNSPETHSELFKANVFYFLSTAGLY